MDWNLSPSALPYYLGAVVLAALGTAAWRRRSLPVATLTAFLVWGIAAWAVAYGLGVNSVDIESKTWFSKLEYVPIVVLPTLWLILVIEYTGRGRWIAPRNLALLAIMPIITLGLVFSNESHRLIWQEVRLVPSGPSLLWEATYGVGFWIHAAYSYSLVLIGIVLLVRSVAASPSFFRIQGLTLAGSGLAPLLGNMLYVSGAGPFPRYFVSFTFFFAATALLWLLFRSHFVTLVPIARNWILDNMSDGLIVLDDENRVVDVNPAAQRLTDRDAKSILGRPVAETMSELVGVDLSRQESIVRELPYTRNGQRFVYELRVSPLFDSRRRMRGRMIVLRDISIRKSAEEVLRRGKDELEHMVEERTAELREAATELQRSRHRLVNTQEEVRRGVAQELHGAVQNRLLVVKHRLNNALEAAQAGSREALDSVANSLKLLDEIIAKDLRAVIRQLHPPLIRMNLLGSLEALGEMFRDSFTVEVHAQSDGLSSQDLWRTDLPEELRLAIYRVTEEALTNARKHSGATAVIIDLEEHNQSEVSVSVRDNGKGFQLDKVIPGFGMLSMHDYCGAEGGLLTLDSQPGQGTTVMARFPRSPDAVSLVPAGGSQRNPTGPLPDPQGSSASEESSGGDPMSQQTIRTLVVDDQPDFCDLVKEILQTHKDFQVIAVGRDGQEAVNLALEHHPDLILMDVWLPRKNGLAATREILASLPDTKIVMISAFHDKGFLEEARQAGALDLIPKSALSVAELRISLTRQPMGQRGPERTRTRKPSP